MTDYNDPAGPEGAPRALVTVRAGSCILCTACRRACDAGAMTIRGSIIRIDPALCDGCGACVRACVPGALSVNAPGAHSGTIESASGPAPGLHAGLDLSSEV